MIWRRLLGYFPASLASGLASFGAVYALTRLLSPASYGFYALALTTMGIVYTLSVTWAEAAAYRFAGGKAEPGHVRTLLALLALSSALALVMMSGAVLMAADPVLRAALIAAMATMVFTPVVNAAQEMNRAHQRVRRYSTLKMCQDLGAFMLGTLLAWQTGLGAASPFVGLASVLAVIAAVEGSRLWRESRGGQFEPKRVKTYLAYGVPVAFALALNIALDAGDRFLIALYLGPEAVGVYAAGYGLADKSVGLLCAWAAAAGGPMMLAAWEGSGERERPHAVREVSAQVARTLLLIAAPAAAGLALVAQPLSEIMIGEAMREQAAAIIPWIALSGLINGFVMHYVSEAFQLSKRTGLRAALMVIPAVMNLVLNAVLLPWIGLMGAVYATVACYALALVLLAGVGGRLAPLAWPWRDFLKVGGACAAMAIFVRFLPATGGLSELLMKAACGAAVYLLAVLAFDAAGARVALQQFAVRRARRV